MRAQASYISGTTCIGGYHLKCNGQSTASIKANPSFGTPPYTFLWNTGETTPELLNKPAGIYSVIMTDSNQVTHADTFEVKQPYVLGYESTLTDYYGFNIDAHGAHTGGIVLNATGGTPPYRYTWNTGDSIANLRELAAGAYSFVITDANHCSTSGNITLTEPNAIQVSFSNIQNLTCFSSDDGKATLSVNGGLGDFSVVWDNGSFSLSPEDLHAGFNAVRIFEQGNAVLDTGITLTQPNKIDIQFSMSNYNGYGVSCVDCFNGTIASTVTGGTAPYTYAWDDVNNSTTAGLSNLNGDKYTLTVIDANGCKAVNTALLTMPKPKDWSRFGNANIDTSMFIGSTDTSAVIFKTNNQETMRMMGNGNVGVGISNPSEKLEVNGTIKAQGLKLNNLNIQYEAASSQGPEKIVWGASTPANAGNIGAPLIPANCLDPLQIDKFNVFDGAAVFKVKTPLLGTMACKSYDPTLFVGLFGCDGAIEVVQDGSVINNGPTSALNKLLLNTNCGRDVVVGKSDGGNLIVNHNLGIGVLNPQYKLDVGGEINGDNYLKNGTPVEFSKWSSNNGITHSGNQVNISYSGNVLSFKASNPYGQINSSTNKIDFWTSPGTWNELSMGKINVHGDAVIDGNFVIGSTNVQADAKLAVKGNIKAYEITVDNTWSDFVFEDNYKLTPLLEVEKYILKNNHLEGIPCAAEIEKKGLPVGELLKLQMQKIEELTLYTIELQKQLIILKEQLKK